jgi:type II secretory pathway component PulF
MSKLTLDDVLAVNEELAALADLGIPTNLGPGAAHSAVPGTLEQINSSLTLRTSLGQSLVSAAAENQELPSIYRSALETGLRSNSLSATLDGISRQATAETELRSTVGRSLISPLIVLAIGYLGFIFLCLYYSPTIEGMYEQVDQPLSRPVGFLVAMREWLPYWATLLPLLIIGAVILWQRGWGGWQMLVPGKQRYSADVRNANFAHQLRSLVDNGIPLEESVSLAAQVTGDAGLIDASVALLDSYSRNEKLPSDAEVLRAVPPLLRWVLTGDLGDQSLPEVLQFAEKAYLHKAERRAALWRYLLPTMIGAFLGGSIVLAYGMSVFVPFVRLLEDLAS